MAREKEIEALMEQLVVLCAQNSMTAIERDTVSDGLTLEVPSYSIYGAGCPNEMFHHAVCRLLSKGVLRIKPPILSPTTVDQRGVECIRIADRAYDSP